MQLHTVNVWLQSGGTIVLTLDPLAYEVHQHGVLYPVLFTLYVNDVVKSLCVSKLGRFIGDTYTGCSNPNPNGLLGTAALMLDYNDTCR